MRQSRQQKREAQKCEGRQKKTHQIVAIDQYQPRSLLAWHEHDGLVTSASD